MANYKMGRAVPETPAVKSPRAPLTISAINGRKVKGASVYELHIVDAGDKSYWYVCSGHGKHSKLFESSEFFSNRANAERSAMRSLQAIFDNAIVVIRHKS